MRIYLANVGANSSDSFASPLFDDGTFEFLPIREGSKREGDKEANSFLDTSPHAIHYRDLRSRSEPSHGLLRYVPERLRNAACHNDPEFETFTYGDGCDNGRSRNLKAIERGDVLLFLVRLSRRAGVDGKPAKLTSEDGFYLVGGLRVNAIFPRLTQQPDAPTLDRIGRNAHVIRAECTGRWDGSWVFSGSDQSRRFQRAVPVTRGVCEQVFRDKNGNPWSWPAHLSELSRIGSYTRACRCMLDTSDPEQAQRTATLRAWIAQYTGDTGAELLEEATE